MVKDAAESTPTTASYRMKAVSKRLTQEENMIAKSYCILRTETTAYT